MAIPKILEQDLQNKDEEAYNALVAQAEEERSRIDVDSIVKVMPEEVNYFKEASEDESNP